MFLLLARPHLQKQIRVLLVDDHQLLVDRPAAALPDVVTRGDDALLALDCRDAWHFPCGPDGAWAGFHPADGDWARKAGLSAV